MGQSPRPWKLAYRRNPQRSHIISAVIEFRFVHLSFWNIKCCRARDSHTLNSKEETDRQSASRGTNSFTLWPYSLPRVYSFFIFLNRRRTTADEVVVVSVEYSESDWIPNWQQQQWHGTHITQNDLSESIPILILQLSWVRGEWWSLSPVAVNPAHLGVFLMQINIESRYVQVQEDTQ